MAKKQASMINRLIESLETNESMVSTVLGAVVLVVVGFLFYNYFFNAKNPNQGGPDNEVSAANSTETIIDNKTETAQNTQGQIAEAASVSKYTVEKGDSLWKIAVKKYYDGYRWSEIASVNRLNNPGKLLVGQQLDLPEGKAAITQAKPSTTTTSTAKITAAQKVSAAKHYTVARGDSLWKISVKMYNNGYKWPQVWRANKKIVANPNVIRRGMTLTIP
jgi:nucleoid-associated protein YgaU